VLEQTQNKEWGNNYYATKKILTGEAKNTENIHKPFKEFEGKVVE
jgi:hypothetical protein